MQPGKDAGCVRTKRGEGGGGGGGMPGIDVECGAPVLLLLLSKALPTGLGGEDSTPFLSPFLLVSVPLPRKECKFSNAEFCQLQHISLTFFPRSFSG